ncbi:MAG: acetoacetate--CoA ligase [Geobacteraceae bacterium GWC2_58_44]|nr:MAG: acetoacetate--CoA ligase [Geobacteraceae bacterium GWC2_58_44]HBG05679.1 acetoacetate--CoA ligase [Geobacter sp.]
MKEPIWVPPKERVQNSAMCRFMAFVNDRHGTRFDCYPDLYRWSVTDIPAFWGAFWDFGEVIASKGFDQVVDDATRMPGARWFSGARLNFAENLLRFRDDATAIVFQGEGREAERLSYAELYRSVARLARALKRAGVQPGDRVAAFMPNLPETVVAMLASVSLGAVWSSCSPDFGIQGVLDRFGQIEPKVLFSADGYLYGGRSFDTLEKLKGIVVQIPSIEQVILVPYLDREPRSGDIPRTTPYDDFSAGEQAGDAIDFAQLPADHPLYIMYSSGTTGRPKCMVQGSAGILLQHRKELLLHTDLRRDDTVIYLTTCGWMMWNWLVSALSCGAALVLYEGSPFHPDPGALWRLAERERITVFGTSARYLASLESSGTRPGRDCDLTPLRSILSTGSPLSADGFRYVYREIKADLQLASISGGTDLNGCFALGDPTSPVYPGELQCRGLGMRVEVYNAAGEPLVGEPGELVCSAPFPSMPLYFWSDPDGAKYRKAYFERFPGVWAHGDWCTLTGSGGMIIHGRSDATLNPGGVRIGSAELYRVVETMSEIADSIVVGQRWQGDERVILFVRLAPGVDCSEELKEKIRQRIRESISPRHVPAKIIPVAEIPYTINMKKVELAVRSVIHGEEVANRDALANPEALDLYRNLGELEE